MRRHHGRWIVLASLFCAHSLVAQPSFLRKDIAVGVAPGFAVAGDFDGDGRMDLAVGVEDPTVYSGWEFAILLNQGEGKFGEPIRTAKNNSPRAWAADFNGDQRDDLVTGDGYLHLSGGDGTFLAPLPIGGERLFPALGVGDFNQDDIPDVVAGLDGHGIRIWQSNGDGTFEAGARFAVVGAPWMAVADFNQDGQNDLATTGTSPDGSGLLVFLGSGDGSFGPEIRTPFINTSASSGPPLLLEPGRAFVEDFNGDNIPDIALGGGIMFGMGDGTFPSSLSFPPLDARGGHHTMAFATADFTGDDRVDLAVAYWGASLISILPGNGDGTFSAPLHEPVGWGHTVFPFWAPVDLDEDDRLDLVSVNSYSGTVSILMTNSHEEPLLPRAVSSASDTAIVAPGSLATLLASTGVADISSASPPWPTKLAGISLAVSDSAGVTRLARIVFVSPDQINFQVPDGTAVGEARLSVLSAGGTTTVGGMQIDAVAPGLFMVSPWNAVPAATAMLVEADGFQIPLPVYRCFPSPTGTDCEHSAIPLAAAGRPLYLTFYGTGFAGANVEDVTCLMSDSPVPVTYAGPQGIIPGVDQINVRVPPEVLQEALFGFSDVIIQIDGVTTNVAFLFWDEWVD